MLYVKLRKMSHSPKKAQYAKYVQFLVYRLLISYSFQYLTMMYLKIKERYLIL